MGAPQAASDYIKLWGVAPRHVTFTRKRIFPMITSIALAGAGHLFAALLFYFFHRCIFHGPLGRWPILRNWAAIHTAHPRAPDEPGAFFFPWWANVAVWAFAGVLFALHPAFGAGMFSFFALYAYRHRRAHLGSKSRWAVHHQSHHYVVPRANFSGTWPVLDRVFGSYEPISPEIVEHGINRRQNRKRKHT